MTKLSDKALERSRRAKRRRDERSADEPQEVEREARSGSHHLAWPQVDGSGPSTKRRVPPRTRSSYSMLVCSWGLPSRLTDWM